MFSALTSKQISEPLKSYLYKLTSGGQIHYKPWEKFSILIKKIRKLVKAKSSKSQNRNYWKWLLLSLRFLKRKKPEIDYANGDEIRCSALLESVSSWKKPPP